MQVLSPMRIKYALAHGVMRGRDIDFLPKSLPLQTSHSKTSKSLKR
jgi:hypothetical protein